MKCRAIWATVAGPLIAILAASTTRANAAAIIGHLKTAPATRLDLSLARLGETGDGKAMVCQSRLLSNKITYQKQ
jgi:hypothetical protein